MSHLKLNNLTAKSDNLSQRYYKKNITFSISKIGTKCPNVDSDKKSEDEDGLTDKGEFISPASATSNSSPPVDGSGRGTR